jgi:hypothetical protein
MTTTQINFQTLSSDLGATPKRLQTIYSKLFGEIEVSADVASPHLKAVLDRIKTTGETLAIAVDSYKLEVTKSHQQSTQATAKPSDKPGKGSVSALLDSDRSATRKLTQKRFTAIIRESNELLANWLQNGLPEGELNDDLENAIFDSSDLVLDAMTEVIDVTGEYRYPQALKPSGNSIAHLLLPSSKEPTNGNGNGNGRHK